MSDDHFHGTEPPSETALRVKAMEQLMVEKGLLRPGAVDEVVDIFEHKLGPRNGARVVAHAWTDPDYKSRLLRDASSAIFELGYSFPGEVLVVRENTPDVHNVVVCTLCSCYPWSTLGLPPNWYKTAPYRSRIVIEPRNVLAEFGLAISDDVEVRVWDSNNEMRYLVLPMRPAGTDDWSVEQLETLVSRDTMIGTSVCKAPEQLQEGASA